MSCEHKLTFAGPFTVSGVPQECLFCELARLQRDLSAAQERIAAAEEIVHVANRAIGPRGDDDGPGTIELRQVVERYFGIAPEPAPAPSAEPTRNARVHCGHPENCGKPTHSQEWCSCECPGCWLGGPVRTPQPDPTPAVDVEACPVLCEVLLGKPPETVMRVLEETHALFARLRSAPPAEELTAEELVRLAWVLEWVGNGHEWASGLLLRVRALAEKARKT